MGAQHAVPPIQSAKPVSHVSAHVPALEQLAVEFAGCGHTLHAAPQLFALTGAHCPEHP